MYTGKPYDSVTGLYYYGARFYDSSIGRFVTQDSYSGKIDDPQSLNRYAYTRDNPMKYTDPSGNLAGGMMKSYDAGGVINCSTDPSSCQDTVVLSQYSNPTGSTVCIGSANICQGIAPIYAKSPVVTVPEVENTFHVAVQIALQQGYNWMASNDPYKNSDCKSTCLVARGVTDYESGLLIFGLTLFALRGGGGEGPYQPVPSGNGGISIAPNPRFVPSIGHLGEGVAYGFGLTLILRGAIEAFYGGFEVGGGP